MKRTLTNYCLIAGIVAVVTAASAIARVPSEPTNLHDGQYGMATRGKIEGWKWTGGATLGETVIFEGWPTERDLSTDAGGVFSEFVCDEKTAVFPHSRHEVVVRREAAKTPEISYGGLVPVRKYTWAARNLGQGNWRVVRFATGTPPTATLQPGNARVFEDQSVTLTAEATGSGPFSYRWSIDGEIDGSATGPTHALADLEAGTETQITCMVSNPLGAAETSATVRCLEHPSVMIESVIVAAGESLTMTASINANYPHTVSWYQDGTLVKETRVITGEEEDDGSSFDLESVPAVEQSISFRCVVNDDQAGVVEAATQVVVLLPVESQTVALGQAITLQARVSQPAPPLAYRWFKGGEEMQGMANRSIGTVAGPDTGGSYSVKAGLLEGDPEAFVESEPGEIIVQQRIAIQYPTEGAHLQQIQGEEFELLPVIEGDAPECLWIHNGQTVASETLLLPQPTSTEDGEWSLVVRNSVSEARVNFYLTFLEEAKIVSFTAPRYVREGNGLKIVGAVGGSLPISAEIRKDSAVLATSLLDSAGETKLLEVTQAKNADSGTYTVTVQGPAGEPASAQTTVQVLPSPVAVVVPARSAIAAKDTLQIRLLSTDPADSLQRVELVDEGGTVLTERNTPPYDFELQNLTAGTLLLRARVTDFAGLAIDSQPVTILVTNMFTPPLTLHLSIADGAVEVAFTASANQDYTILSATNATGPWQTLTNILAAGQSREVRITEPASGPMRFYQVAEGALTSEPPQNPPPLAFTTTPQDVSVRENAQLHLGAATAGGQAPLSYAWYFLSEGQTNLLEGADGPALMLEGVSTADAGGYFVEVKDSAGAVIRSPMATVTVTLAPSVILNQPEDQEATAGGSARFEVQAQGESITYQWYRLSWVDESAQPEAIPGAAQAVLVVDPVGEGDGYFTYFVKVNATIDGIPAEEESASAVLTVE